MPGSPYTDLDRPPLSAARLSRALTAPLGPWRRLDLRSETGSTNADAADAARAGQPEGLIVVAERQTAGRGRRGRVWQSPPRAGLAASVLLRPGEAVTERDWPPASPTGYGWLPLLAGVALVEAVSRLAELDAGLKWPNDLLVGDGASAPGSWPRRCRRPERSHRGRARHRAERDAARRGAAGEPHRPAGHLAATRRGHRDRS